MIKRIVRRMTPGLARYEARIQELERAVRELQVEKERLPELLRAAHAADTTGVMLAHERFERAHVEACMEEVRAHAELVAGAARDAARAYTDSAISALGTH